MKLCIFSDIHGNIYAFEKIIKSMKSKNPDMYIFCGDICGYYYHQNEIIDLMRGLKNFTGILGNHDKVFLDMFDGVISGREYTLKYGKANSLLLDEISPENLNFLRKLKETEFLTVKNNKIAVFHGSPWNHLNDYIYPDSPIERFEELEYDFIFLGNTHYPMDRISGNVRLINPGSCGQPRDFNVPSYAFLDLTSKKIEFARIDYDYKPLIKEINDNNETNNYLIEVLTRGKKDRGGMK